MRRIRAGLLVLSLVVAACGGGTNNGETPPNGGAESPTAAVEGLVAAFAVPDFAGAAHLALEGQAALASLAEGASFGDVAAALRNEGAAVTANFWSGFAQGAGEYMTGDVTVADAGTETVSGIEFHRVRVTLPDGGTRYIYLREDDGYRIDLFASFGGGMAARMIQPAERLLITQTDDARLIRAGLREIVPSLTLAAANPDLMPGVANDLIRLIEVITR
jgi:hypothetical protein